LEITRDDINNRVRKIKGQRKEEEQRDVSPAIPFHIIRDPSLSTNLDLSVSASSNEQNPLDILAVKPFERLKIQIKLKILVECNSPFPINARTMDVAHLSTLCRSIARQSPGRNPSRPSRFRTLPAQSSPKIR
jgi:hypothetical protein